MTNVIPGIYDFDVLAGATFDRFIRVNQPKEQPTDPDVPYSFVGHTGRAQMRKSASSAQAYDFVVTFPVNGTIQLHMDNETTASIVCGNQITDDKSRYKWALEIEDEAGNVVRLLEGVVRVSAEIVK